MPLPLRAVLTRLGGWPRRVAALLCLLLAGGTALARPAAPSASPRTEHGLTSRLRHGQVAVPVVLDAAAATGFLRPGDRIGLLAAPADGFPGTGSSAGLIADRLRVLAISGGTGSIGGDQGATVIVAADAGTAQRIAAASAGRLLPVLDETT